MQRGLVSVPIGKHGKVPQIAAMSDADPPPFYEPPEMPFAQQRS